MFRVASYIELRAGDWGGDVVWRRRGAVGRGRAVGGARPRRRRLCRLRGAAASALCSAR